jgi:hypothetical protein
MLNSFVCSLERAFYSANEDADAILSEASPCQIEQNAHAAQRSGEPLSPRAAKRSGEPLSLLQMPAIGTLNRYVRISAALIPSPIDQNRWAHWRNPMDMVRQG